MVASILRCAGVYAITSLACRRIYVGSSVNIGRRWIWHRAELHRGRHCAKKLQDVWMLHGEKNLSFAILEIVTEVGELRAREQYWLDFLSAADYGLNTLHMVDNLGPWTRERRAAMSAKRMGHPVSAETREKLRQANLGKKTHTEESKAKLRAANLGKKMSADAIARTAAYWTGRTHSPETRQKISAAHKLLYANGYINPAKGRKLPPETIAKLIGRKHSQETKDKLSKIRRASLGIR